MQPSTMRLPTAIALALLFVGVVPAYATAVSLTLDCVMNGLPGEHGCPTLTGDPFGEIVLVDDGDGAAPDTVNLTVDLAGTEQKFRDLMLSFTPTDGSITGFSGGTLSPNAFSISPYAGLFDVFVGGGDDGFMTTFSADQPLTVSNFVVTDSLGILYAAIHLQNIGPGNCDGSDDGTTDCVPGMTGGGSLKIGASGFDFEGPLPPEEIIPEPSTTALLGGGLIGLLLLRKRQARRRSEL